ncbi:MAG: sugar transferase [Anaerolineae bacterium]|nr:sugar transferase [Anaerolineae bacterium]
MAFTAAAARPQVNRSKRGYQLLKRLIDLGITIMVLPMILPAMAFIALLIRFDSPGPALFKQKRVGKDGRIFNIYKFRTMTHNLDDSYHQAFMKAFVQGQIGEAEGDEKTVFKPFTDSQVTRVGRILRKTSLDELPQLINILKGDMSLIGPRPNVLWEVEAYKEWHKERLSVLPGITGLAQVNGRSAISFDKIVQYDVEYARHQSLWLDLQILWKTFTSVVAGEGAA